MKKDAIKKAVENATAKHVPHAIKEVARSRAFGQVYDALREGSEAEEAAESPAEEAAEMASETVSNAFPSAPSRGGSSVSNTPAAVMAAAMTGRGGRTGRGGKAE